MKSNFVVGRIKGVVPIVALAVVAVVTVAGAMTLLGDTVADATPTPSESASASPIGTPGPPSATPSETASPVATVSLAPAMPSVIIVYHGEHDPHRIWYVVWRYPQFRSGSTPLADLMNADILDEVQTRITAFQVGPAAVRQAPGKTNTITGTFTTNMLSYDLASFTLRWVDDTLPAHPLTTIETLNYSLASGQRLGLGDLFIDYQAALAVISQSSRDQLRGMLGAGYDDNVLSTGTGPSSSNFDNWVFTPTGLRITFAAGQVGPTSAGMPTVAIPWSSLEPFIRPDGPAARLAGLPPLVPTTGASPSPEPSPEPSPSPSETPDS